MAEPLDLVVPERMNASEAFLDRNLRAGRGGSTAVIDASTGASLTYAKVLAQVNRVGHALRRIGVRPEERVMILLPDSPEFVYSFFGAIRIGAVAVPVNTLLKPHDYQYLLEDSRARTLIVHERFLPAIQSIRPSLRHLEHLVVAGVPADDPASFERFIAAESDQLAPVEMCRDDAAFWLYSSGTTGFPKGAVHLQHDMLCCAEAFGRRVLGITAADRTYSVARLFFAYGLGNALYFPFYVGAATVLHPGRPEPGAIFDLVERYRPTLFYAVPTFYAAMLAAMDAGVRPDFSSVRLCSSAGEPLAASLYERWLGATGVEILDGIGSTEVLHTFIANRAGRVRPGSSGELVPGYEARIVGPDDRDLPDGEIGDLWIRGDSICAGYWNKQVQTCRTISGEWIRTGDKYSRDADGYFWYHGRTDDMMKVGGQWVSPAEVESAMVTHEAVLECAVVAREDDRRLVKPMAYVVLKAGRVPSEDLAQELQAHVKALLALHKYPRWVEFIEELPKTATGKIQRYRLRALVSSPSSAPGAPPIVT